MLSADLDLRKLAAETRLTLSLSAGDLKFWSGPPPSAAVVADNAVEAPRRQLDVSSLSAGLAAQAIARETDRIAAMEADIRERAYFNRRLKGERLMDRRRQEIEDFEVEQSRLKGLAERLRAQEETEKAAELEAAAAKKAAAEKAAADNAEAAKTEAPDGEATTAAKAPFAPAPAAAKTDDLGAERALADAPSEAKSALAAGRPVAWRPLLIELSVPLGLEHKHPNGRRQIGVAARGVDHRSHLIERQSALAGDASQPAPERILDRDAGAMSGDDQRAFDDAQARGVSRHRGDRADGLRGWRLKALARSRRDVSRLSSGRRRRGSAPLPLARARASFAFASAGG